MASGYSRDLKTDINVLKTSYTWSISNFIYHGKRVGERLESPLFSGVADCSPNAMCVPRIPQVWHALRKFAFNPYFTPNNNWCINFYPGGFTADSEEYIGVFLTPHKDALLPVVADLEIFILGADNKKLCQQRMSPPHKFHAGDAGWGWPTFLKCEELLEQADNLLPGGALTLGWTLSVVSDVLNNTMTIPETRHQLAIDFNKLLTDETFTDVVLIAEGEDVKAHKNILSARSSVFAAMFSNGFAENMTNRVEMVDMTVPAVKEMLRFIYTENVDNLKENAEELFVAGDKYFLDGLKEMSLKALASNITIQNAARVFRLADLHAASQLKAKAADFIRNNMEEVQETDGWQKLKNVGSKSIVEGLTERPTKKLRVY